MKEKIKLLRAIEERCGYSKFKIKKTTTEEEINNALNYIRSSWRDYKDYFKSKVDTLMD